MDVDEPHHAHHAARTVVIDGVEHSVYRERIAVAELYDLAAKSPDEWQVQAELQGGDTVDLGLDDELDLHVDRPAAFHMKRRSRHHHVEPCLLTVVVTSDPVRLEVDRSSVVRAVVAEALAKANAVGRERGDWQLKTSAGVVLDQSLTLEEAGIECGSTLFLSLKAGAAGEAATELLVDPQVSAAKFEAEVSAFQALRQEHSRRGIWLLRADYPTAVVLFASPRILPLRVLAFAAVVDFRNYDLWAPSVRIVDPLTEVPYRGADLPQQAYLWRRTGKTVAGTGGQAAEVGRFMVWQEPDEIPFLCHAGVREYHAHPAHTGDSWLLHRGGTEGTLARIVELLFQYGSAGMVGLNVGPALGLPPE